MIKFCVNLKHSITQTNELFYAAPVVVSSRIGVKINNAGERKMNQSGGGGYKIRLKIWGKT